MGGCGFSDGYRESLHIAPRGHSLQPRPFSSDFNCLARCSALAPRAAKASSVSVRVASGHLPRGAGATIHRAGSGRGAKGRRLCFAEKERCVALAVQLRLFLWCFPLGRLICGYQQQFNWR
jgi:hypothetical protein